MYYARGYCKNGSSCCFLHGVPKDDAAEREMAVMRAKALAAAPPQLMASAYPFSPSPKGGVSLSFLLQQHQQQSETQRCHFYPAAPTKVCILVPVSCPFCFLRVCCSRAAAAAGMLLGGEDMHRFPVRSPRMDRGDLIASPAARQIYLTFPADSTFSEEDVSNYFRYPAQQAAIIVLCSALFCFVSTTSVSPGSSSPIMGERNRLIVLVAMDRAACSGRCRTCASRTSRSACSASSPSSTPRR